MSGYSIDPETTLALEQNIRNIIGERDIQDNRRFALDRALLFYKNSAVATVVGEAPVYLAEIYFNYITGGTLPDRDEVASSVRESIDTSVRHALPPYARPEAKS